MTKSGAPFRFKHLYLENWKSFTKADIDLARRTCVVGPSACGKTNLLDAFRFLHDLVSAGGFQRAVRSRGGVSRLRCLAARQNPHVAIAVRVGSDENGPDWEYELEFGQENLRKPAIVRERVTRDGEDILSRPDEKDAEDPERLSESALQQVLSNGQFRELAVFFESIRYFNAVPQIVRKPGRSTGGEEDPFGGNLLEQIASTPENVQQARLRRIREALDVAAPHLEALDLRTDARGVPHLRARYGHWRALGAWQTEEQLSDGTLRLVALLWAALDGSGPLLVEEPEQSLHAEVARELASMLRGVQRRTERQMLITTHSKELLSDQKIAPEETLLLVPGEEGTMVRPAGSLQDAAALLDGCFRGAEPLVDEDQLALFDEF